MRQIAVIGGGWSGLSAAVALTAAGRDVTLLEAAPQLGGRARRLELQLGDRAYPLDNGQHLLIGAYCQALALMRQVAVEPDRVFVRQPFALRYPDGFTLQAARLPAPLHLAVGLLRAHGLSWRDRLAMARTVARWKRAGWRTTRHQVAAELMAGLPAAVVERVWEPLCVAALNVRLAQASAAVFLTVLRDSLGADRGASDMLVPRTDLSALFPDAAARTLQQRGARVQLRAAVERLTPGLSRWHVEGRHAAIDVGAVVLALPPERAAALLGSTGLAALDEPATALRRVESAPITTAYLRYPAGTRLAHPVYTLVEAPRQQDFGQWVFDRGALDRRCDGVLSVVISARGMHEALDHGALGRAVAAQLGSAFSLPAPIAIKVIEEKRATLVASPALVRPPTVLPAPGLFLAGDAADSAYPSTIEGSVRSGLAAARAVLATAVRP